MVRYMARPSQATGLPLLRRPTVVAGAQPGVPLPVMPAAPIRATPAPARPGARVPVPVKAHRAYDSGAPPQNDLKKEIKLIIMNINLIN